MKKSLLKISILLMIFLMLCPVIVQAAISDGYTFGITNQRTEGGKTYIYSFLPADKTKHEYIWNVQRKNGSIAVTDEVYYCLAHRYGDFGSFNSEVPGTPIVAGGDSASSYSGAYNLKENGVINTINSVYNGTQGNTLTGTAYNSMLWILDHMFINGEDSIDDFLKGIQWKNEFKLLFDDIAGVKYSLNPNGYENLYDFIKDYKNTDAYITVSDIEVIQQLAIWHFTNPTSVTAFPTVNIAVDGGSKGTYEDLFTNTEGKRRKCLLDMIFSYLVYGGQQAVADASNLYSGDNITTALVYINAAAQPVLRLTRERELTGEYNVVVKKVDTNGNTLPNAKFTINGVEKITNESGTVETGAQAITESNVTVTDTFEIKETEAPTGYIKYNGTINLSVTKKEATDGSCYVINTATLDATSNASSYVSIDNNTNTITITVKDEPIVGNYSVKIVKKDENGNTLPGAVFTIGGANYPTDSSGETTIASNVVINKDNVGTTDTYTITETTAPTGYKKINGEIRVDVTKKQDGNRYVLDEVTLTSPTGAVITKTVDNDNQLITITVTNEEQPGEYGIVLVKKNQTGGTLSGAVFTLGSTDLPPTNDAGIVMIASNVTINDDNVNNKDTYILTEKTPPSGYKKIEGQIKVEVEKERVNGVYRVKDVTLTAPAGITYNLDSNKKLITLTVTDEEILGAYSVKINKRNQKGEALPGAKFTINGTEYTTDSTGNITLINNKTLTIDNIGTETFNLTEISAPSGYVLYDGTVTLEVTTGLLTNGNYGVTSKSLTETVPSEKASVNLDEATNTVTVTIIEDNIDLALRKFISKVTDKNNNDIYTNTQLANRVPYVDTTKLVQRTDTTAEYNHSKVPVRVSVDNTVTYTLRVYNEGETDAYITEITDYLSKYLQPVDSNEWTTVAGTNNDKYTTKLVSKATTKVTGASNNLSGLVGTEIGTGILLPAFDKTNNGLSYIDVQVKCKVLKPVISENSDINGYKITNIAEITGMSDKNGNVVNKDVDSNPRNVNLPDDENSWQNYKDNEMNKSYIPGQQDDDDFEKLVVIEGRYSIRINKQNQKGEVLQNAKFSTILNYSDSGVINKEITTDQDGYATIANNIIIDESNVNRTDTYKITEIKAPTGYSVYDGEITLTVTKKQEGDLMVLNNATIDETSSASGDVTISIDRETNSITVIIKENTIDLALRKFISKVTSSDNNEVYTNTQLANRVPDVDTTKLVQNADTTAEYNHTKKALQVSIGDLVTYTFRVYNEGESDAYITEVTDYLPKYLEPVENNEWYISYGTNEDKYVTKLKSSTVTTITGASDNLSAFVGQPIGEGILLPAFNKTENKLSYIDMQVVCKVLTPETDDNRISDYKITNIAEITGMKDKKGNQIDEDIDSRKDNVNLPEDEENWEKYKDTELDKTYIPGQQDDDDFEKITIIIPKYDLALRKFISKVNDKAYNRAPQVDTTSLKQGIAEKTYGTATYNHTKEPISVRRKDIVTYTIRVYNEGNVNAYVSEITDHLPEYLEFLKDDELNKKYGWKYDENSRVIYTNITSKSAEDTDGLYTDRTNGKLLLAFDGGATLDYIDVQIRCKVAEKSEAFVKQTNIAEITGITDTNEDDVEDVDSTPENVVIPEDKDLPDYKDDELDKEYIPGQEDDDDFEKIIVKGEFDLALRKFITKVNSVSVNNRYPQLSIDENGDIKYTHTKVPVEVCYQDIVYYTIRVYNEGEIDGYANEVTDDVPEGLEFVIDNEINKTYRWKMLDENQKETDDVSKAKYLVTDYLSEDQNSEERNNLIKAFKKSEGLSDTNPDYRDLQIAFKVTYKVTDPNEESRILVNVAQISKDSDDDIDSIPNRDEEYDDDDHEDDIDYEQVKVKYFDLSLLKWVSQVIVVENGKTSITDTGHTGEENPEPVVKVEIKTKSVDSIIVKFAYRIKITNEGEIAGYAKEITDYIPAGLKFVEEDNPDWYVREDGKVATKQLENTLLQPGETADVEIILTWINGEKNLGTKINIAEISDDDNPSKTPDIDSTPDNEKEGEDDIDDAPVMLVIKTGTEINPQYTILAGVVLVILTTGTILIKKFVL